MLAVLFQLARHACTKQRTIGTPRTSDFCNTRTRPQDRRDDADCTPRSELMGNAWLMSAFLTRQAGAESGRFHRTVPGAQGAGRQGEELAGNGAGTWLLRDPAAVRAHRNGHRQELEAGPARPLKRRRMRPVAFDPKRSYTAAEHCAPSVAHHWVVVLPADYGSSLRAMTERLNVPCFLPQLHPPATFLQGRNGHLTGMDLIPYPPTEAKRRL
jgi:hypothetical protein